MPRTRRANLCGRVRVGDAAIELGEGDPMPGSFMLYVVDPDAMYQDAITAGATSIMPLSNQPVREGRRCPGRGGQPVVLLATCNSEQLVLAKCLERDGRCPRKASRLMPSCMS